MNSSHPAKRIVVLVRIRRHLKVNHTKWTQTFVCVHLHEIHLTSACGSATLYAIRTGIEGSNMRTILVTGGAGYIGSHTCLALLEAGYEVVVADNFSNSKREVMRRIEDLSGKKVPTVACDLCDRTAVENLFEQFPIQGVIHFAGLKAVGESVAQPLRYYQNNLTSTLHLLNCMEQKEIYEFVFSSSATVYGDPHAVPIKEDFPLHATNPYGRSKLMIEEMLRDLYQSNQNFRIAILRYFNPAGAHPSGTMGEDPNGIPNNLMPYIAQVAVGKRPSLTVFGKDYPTKDGTGVRDYIHVVDLAEGHVAALRRLEEAPGLVTCNLGTGRGYSVLEMVHAFEEASGHTIPYAISGRRPGDIAQCYCDPKKSAEELHWHAKLGVYEMCRDTWNWQSKNPNGYDEAKGEKKS